MIKNILKTWGKSTALLVMLSLLGILFLFFAYCIPVNESKKEKTYSIINNEGGYPDVLNIATPYNMDLFFSYFPGVLDQNGTDGVYILSNTFYDSINPLYDALNMQDYEYYWHGYVSVLRPILNIFDISELRFLNYIFQSVLVFCISYLIKKEKGIIYAALFFSSFIMLMPLAIVYSLQYSPCLYIMLLSVLGILIFKERKKQTIGFSWFVVIGAITVYFDLLTYPLVTWGYSIIWLLLLESEVKIWDYCKKVIVSGIGWIYGYAGMWLFKWLIASLILKENVISSAISEVIFRTGKVADTSAVINSRFEALYNNLKHYTYKIYAIVILLWVVYFLSRLLIRGINMNKKIPAMCLICLTGVLWCLVLSNHTWMHHFFTYRILSVAFIAVFAGFIELTGGKNDGITIKPRALIGQLPSKWKEILTVIVCGIIALIVTIFQLNTSINYFKITEYYKFVIFMYFVFLFIVLTIFVFSINCILKEAKFGWKKKKIKN